MKRSRVVLDSVTDVRADHVLTAKGVRGSPLRSFTQQRLISYPCRKSDLTIWFSVRAPPTARRSRRLRSSSPTGSRSVPIRRQVARLWMSRLDCLFRGETLSGCFQDLSAAESVLIIGGGIVGTHRIPSCASFDKLLIVLAGVELAAEVAEHFPHKDIVLVHSGPHLMNGRGTVPPKASAYARRCESVSYLCPFASRTRLPWAQIRHQVAGKQGRANYM